MRAKLLLVGLVLAAVCANAADVLVRNVVVYDGSGAPGYAADVRIHGDRIATVGRHLVTKPGEAVRDGGGLALAPGFIDMHSHHDRGLLKDLDAATVSRQGVTTILVGQDGRSNFPLTEFFHQLEATPPAINVASMVGHATLRMEVMGHDLYRPSTTAELERMKILLESELAAGAFGLSTGLEYEQAHAATTAEVVELSKVAVAGGGFYISHVRNEAERTFESFDEVLQIARQAHIRVEITHIKLGATSVWHQAKTRMPGYFATARREHLDLKADVYPYTFWYSTIRVLIPDGDYYNPEKVARALSENGGAGAILISRYKPDPTLAGKTLDDFATVWHVTPVEAYMRVVRETSAEVNAAEPLESVNVTSMSEDDVRWFIAQPEIMFSSDGELHGCASAWSGRFSRAARPVRKRGAGAAARESHS